MNNERDPLLESLFDDTRPEVHENGFSDQVMAGVEKRRRNVLLGRIGLVALLVVFELLLSSPIEYAIGTAMQALSTPLLDVGGGWLAAALAPLNSGAGLIGVLLVGLHWLYRRRMR